jgi:hypothetical protein
MTPEQKLELKKIAKTMGYQIRVTKHLVAVSGCHYCTFKNDSQAFEIVKENLAEAAVVFAERIAAWMQSRS